MRKVFPASALLAIPALLGVATSASAATINWQSSVNMYQGATVETFVDTTGTTAVAYNNTPDAANGNVTVNTVSFTQELTGNTLVGGSGESITINGGTDNTSAFGDGEFSSNANIFHLIRGGTFGINSVTLGGLQNGQQYLVQVFHNDARSSRSLNFIAGLGDGSASGPVGISELNNSPANGDPPTFPETEAGDSIIGTFTADSATLTFEVFGTNSGNVANLTQGDGRAQINAIQLRLVPEPGSLALLGLGGLLIARRRRG